MSRSSCRVPDISSNLGYLWFLQFCVLQDRVSFALDSRELVSVNYVCIIIEKAFPVCWYCCLGTTYARC
jgi:hypothetical protein